MNRSILRPTVVIGISLLSAAIAQAGVVVSDGPDHSNPPQSQKIVVSDGPGESLHSRSQIVTTDGPSRMPYKYPPDIITTDGPSQLPYSYPPKIAVTSGPSDRPFSHLAKATKVKLRPHKGGGISGLQRRSRPISRYAEERRLLRSPEASGTRQRNGEVVVSDGPGTSKALPDPETSTLASALP